MDGEPRELQNPAQSAMGEERGDHERTPWLAKMCWDKHFLFYSILENIKCFRVIFQILWTLLCPLLKGPTPSAWYQTKDQQKLNNLNSILFNKMLTSGKKVKKNEQFLYSIFDPLSSLVKKTIKKTKTDMHNYNMSSIQIHFSSYRTFGAFVRKPKSIKKSWTGNNSLAEVDFIILFCND